MITQVSYHINCFVIHYQDYSIVHDGPPYYGNVEPHSTKSSIRIRTDPIPSCFPYRRHFLAPEAVSVTVRPALLPVSPTPEARSLAVVPAPEPTPLTVSPTVFAVLPRTPPTVLPKFPTVSERPPVRPPTAPAFEC